MCRDETNQQARGNAPQIDKMIVKLHHIGPMSENNLGGCGLNEIEKMDLDNMKTLKKSFVGGGKAKNPIKRGAISAGVDRREGSNATAFSYDYNADAGAFVLGGVEGDTRRRPTFTHPTPKLLAGLTARQWMNGVVGGCEGNSHGRLYVMQCDTHPDSIRYADDRSYGIKGLRCTLEGRTLTETLRRKPDGTYASPRKGWAEGVMHSGKNEGKPAGVLKLKGWCKQCHREAGKDYNDKTGQSA